MTWNSAPTLETCLRSLQATRSVALEQIVCVDNGSRDDSVALAGSLGADVISLGSNSGFPRAVNTAIPRCTGEFLLLLNPDVVLEPETIKRCVTVLESDPVVGLVGANLRRPDGRPDLAAARRFRTLGLLAIETTGLTTMAPWMDLQYLPRWDRTTSRRVPCINGAFALIRASLLREIGGLDESVFLYFEDQELCRQVWHRGYSVHFAADAVALHHVSAATSAARPDQQAAAYLHRIDASVEIIRRLQGDLAAYVAVALWMIRAGVGLAASRVIGDHLSVARYAQAVRWLSRQIPRRQAAPPVPS